MGITSFPESLYQCGLTAIDEAIYYFQNPPKVWEKHRVVRKRLGLGYRRFATYLCDLSCYVDKRDVARYERGIIQPSVYLRDTINNLYKFIEADAK